MQKGLGRLSVAKIIEGVALLAVGFLTFEVGGFFLTGEAAALLTGAVTSAIVGIGASLTLAGIAQALQTGPSSPFTFRQAAAPRTCIYGQVRVPGVIVYISSSNGGEAVNQVIVWAAHQCQSVQNIYLDGRQVYLNGSHQGDGNTYYDQSNNSYSFGATDIQACYHNLGTVPGTQFFSLSAVDSLWQSTMTMDGLCSTYIRTGYDTNRFASAPAAKATIYGKCDIYDPRTGARGYTNNAALVIADFLCSTDWGPGCVYANEIDEEQLIAAANICDEQVALAAGGTESRYTINGSFSSDGTPGEILDALLQCCEGRISYVGGVWKIYPAAWLGSSLSLDQNALVDKIVWSPARKYRDLVNSVRATYISPRYPYASIGYDQDHKNTGIFSGEWQPCDAPEYAQDALHGYSSDVNLTQDGNVKLYTTRSYRFCTSVATCQRLMKIYMLRNRFQGSGTLRMSLVAYQLEAQDVFEFTFAPLGMTNKYLEVDSFRLVPKIDDVGNEPPVITCEINVNETDPSIYEWSTAEERTWDNAQSPTFLDPYTVQPPTSVHLTSGQAAALIGADGIITPRILVSWTSPNDPFVASGGDIEIQYSAVGPGNFYVSAGKFSPSVTSAYLPNVTAGTSYSVQMFARRGNGATSPLVTAGPILAAATGSLVSYSAGLNAVANPGFETNILSNACGDGWSVGELDPGASMFNIVARESDGSQRTGAANLLIRVSSNQPLTASQVCSCRVFSDKVNIGGGQPLYYGGYINWGNSVALNLNLNTIGRIGVYFVDGTGAFISEVEQDLLNAPGGGWIFQSGEATAPSTAVAAILQCSVFITNLTTGVQYTPTGFPADMRFDDVFLMQQPQGSGILSAQGSINPSQGIVIPGSFSNSSCTLSWASQSVLSSNPGSVITTNSGSVAYTGLASSTTYYTYWRIVAATGVVQPVNGSPPPTSPNDTMAINCSLDGYVPIGVVSFTTLAASNTGTGSFGGGDPCPIHTELVNVRGKGHIEASLVNKGDWIHGYDFKNKTDVYRLVTQVRRVEAAVWRSVNGHLVSPCEPIYHGGKWVPAHQASNVVDHTVGDRMKISVHADSDGEHNYWLVAGTPLLIHNTRVYGC